MHSNHSMILKSTQHFSKQQKNRDTAITVDGCTISEDKVTVRNIKMMMIIQLWM